MCGGETMIAYTLVATFFLAIGSLESHVTSATAVIMGGLENNAGNVSLAAIGGVEDHVTLASLTIGGLGDNEPGDRMTSIGALWNHVSGFTVGLQYHVTSATGTSTSAGGTTVQATSSGGILSKADYLRITKAVVIFSTPLSFLGILTNSVTIAVYRRMPASVTSTYFLLTTFIDLAYLIVTLSVVLMAFSLDFDTAQQCSYVYKFYFRYATLFVGAALRRVAHCVTMLISLDRCFLIAFPFKARNLQHIRRPRLYVGICFVFVFAMRIPWLFFFEVVRFPKAPPGCLSDDPGYMRPTSFYLETRENGWGTLFRYAFTVLLTYVPVIVMGLSTIYMLSQLVRHTKESPGQNNAQHDVTVAVNNSDQSSQNASQGYSERPQTESTARSNQSQFFKLQRQNSITVLIYTGFYLILALPDTMQTLLATFMPGYEPGGKENYLVLTMTIIYNLLDVLSCTMNFFVLVTTGSAFRAQVMAMIFGEPRRERSGNSKSSTGTFVD